MAHGENTAKGEPVIISLKLNHRELTHQCDACAPIHFVNPPIVENQIHHTQRFLVLDNLIRHPIDGDHAAYLAPSNSTFSILNSQARNILDEFSKAESLEEIHQNKEDKENLVRWLSDFTSAGLLRTDDYPPKQVIQAHQKIAAWLHLTDRCNLRCNYCYLPHQNIDMNEDVGKTAIDATFRSAEIHGYRTVKFKYAGGEPLLRPDLIETLHRHALVRAKERRVQLEGVILSNGTLVSQAAVQIIQELDLRIMISLDGINFSHDIQRPFAHGDSSFHHVTEGIELLLKNGIYPDISVTVTSQNCNKLCDLTAWLLERNLPFSFNLYRENDLSRDQEGLRLDESRIIAGLKAAYSVIESHLPDKSLLAGLLDQTNLSGPHLYPCSVGHSYLVFDALGRVSKCQMQMDTPVASIEDNDPLTLVRQKDSGIQNLPVEDKSNCRKCQWKYWCAGGCPLSNFRSTGSFAGASPNCAIYKALLPVIMRLEGLRLLEEHQASR